MAYWVANTPDAGFVPSPQSHWVIPGYNGTWHWYNLWNPSPSIYIQKAAWAGADLLPPDVTLGAVKQIPALLAQGDMLTPVILLGSTVGPIGLAPVSNARVFPPDIWLTQKITVSNRAAATARLYVPTLKIGWDMVPTTPMRAGAGVYPPVVQVDSVKTLPLLSATGQVFTPVVQGDSKQVIPLLAATSKLYVPNPLVSIAPVTTTFISGAGPFTYVIPNGAQNIDIIAIGGGGGSAGTSAGGQGMGNPGIWAGATYAALAYNGQTININLGVGGNAGVSGAGAGGAGGATTVLLGGTTLVTAAGGASGYSGAGTAGTYTFNGITYTGGGLPPTRTPGIQPGGGAGNRPDNFNTGYKGGAGGVWIRAY